jgi:hypothetical protein
MPFLQGIAERANEQLNRENISKVRLTDFKETSLGALASALGFVRNKIEKDYLDSWPQSLQAALRAVLQSAIERKPPVPVTIAWTPGYDYEINVWESKSIKKSIGAITIVLRSPYPDVP